MTSIEKFRSDAFRIAKNANHQKEDALHTIKNFFVKSSSAPKTLTLSLSDYWQHTVTNHSLDDNAIEKACSFLALLLGCFSCEDESFVSEDDWQEIANIVSSEAEDIPLETLSSIMSILVEKKVL